MDWNEQQFIPGAGDTRAASPLQAEDVSDAAPTMVVTAGFDPLRDEGEAYARRLQEAGVHTVLRRHPGQVHGFLNMVGVNDTARLAIAEMGGVLRTLVA
jgi:acetyl esterase